MVRQPEEPVDTGFPLDAGRYAISGLIVQPELSHDLRGVRFVLGRQGGEEAELRHGYKFAQGNFVSCRKRVVVGYSPHFGIVRQYDFSITPLHEQWPCMCTHAFYIIISVPMLFAELGRPFRRYMELSGVRYCALQHADAVLFHLFEPVSRGVRLDVVPQETDSLFRVPYTGLFLGQL